MKVQIRKDDVLFTNEQGEYHLSLEKFKEMGEEAATNYAASEIEKKQNVSVDGKKIDYALCRRFGFCSIGIKDFCEMVGLNLDVNITLDKEKTGNSFTRQEIIDATTVKAFEKYPDEILKITNKKILDKWGGLKSFIEKTGIVKPLLTLSFFTEIELHELSCKFARTSLAEFEKMNPDDKNPRLAIEAKEKVIKIMREEGITSLKDYV